MTTTPTMPSISTADLAARYQDLAARRDQLTQEMDAIKTELRLTLGDTYSDENVSIRTNKRFSVSRANEFIETNPAWAALITETTISSTLAKKNLPPALYEDLMVPVGDPIVRFK